MKQVDIRVRVDGDTLTLINKKKENSTYLSCVARLGWLSDKKLGQADSLQNYIRLPQAVKDTFEDRYCTLVNEQTGAFLDVLVDEAVSEDGERMQMTGYVARLLGATADTVPVVCRQNSVTFSRQRLQVLDNIKDDVIVLPKGTYIEQVVDEFRLFEVINTLTNDSIYVRSDRLRFEKNLKPEEIRINKKQRDMLSDNIPGRLTKAQWAKLTTVEQTTDTEEAVIQEAYRRVYQNEGLGYTLRISIDEMDYTTRQRVKKGISYALGEAVLVRPVMESFHHQARKGLARRLADFYVGKSTLSLDCRRPHECDENTDIVRMSHNNMQILGIQPMDRIILQHKERTVSCHVLPYDVGQYGRTNIPGVVELAVGIPAHLRKELGIPDIQSSVKVDRDTVFIFKKSFNEQLVPLILTLVSLKFFEQLPWYFTVLILLLVIPVVMYITLSSKRNMRSK